MRARGILLVFSFVASASAGEVLFSRRVYLERGASYQQIWSWNPADGFLKALTNSARDHYTPVCHGRTITFTTDQRKMWGFNPATGEERVIGVMPEPKEEPDSRTHGCDQFAKLGELEACDNEEALVISRSGKQVGRLDIKVNKTPIRSLQWTKDGKWLLVSEEGLNDGSGQRQEDYYLVNIATMKLSTVASAERAFWLPGRDWILYVTPQGLAPLPGGSGKHSVWVQQLMLFDPVQVKSTAITSGLSNNADPSWCEIP